MAIADGECRIALLLHPSMGGRASVLRGTMGGLARRSVICRLVRSDPCVFYHDSILSPSLHHQAGSTRMADERVVRYVTYEGLKLTATSSGSPEAGPNTLQYVFLSTQPSLESTPRPTASPHMTNKWD